MGWDSNIVIRGEYSELPLTTSLTYVDERVGRAAEHLEIAARVAGRLHRRVA